MAKMFVGEVFEALDEERIALRVKVAMLKDQGGGCAEFQLAAERLSDLEDQLRAILPSAGVRSGNTQTGGTRPKELAD
jgi:hypothetical protein